MGQAQSWFGVPAGSVEQQDDRALRACAGPAGEQGMKAHDAIAEIGSPAMLALARALLWQVGQAIMQREERRKEMLRFADGETRRDGP